MPAPTVNAPAHVSFSQKRIIALEQAGVDLLLPAVQPPQLEEMERFAGTVIPLVESVAV